jgi:hypothetical protein
MDLPFLVAGVFLVIVADQLDGGSINLRLIPIDQDIERTVGSCNRTDPRPSGAAIASGIPFGMNRYAGVRA